jgi:hypothetical protein
VQCVVILSQTVYPYSALRMQAASYSDTSVLTYQTTRWHNAEAQNMNIECSQTLSLVRYYKYTIPESYIYIYWYICVERDLAQLLADRCA